MNANHSCPKCSREGRKVTAVTVGSLAKPKALGRLQTRDGFRFCATHDCEVAYAPFGGIDWVIVFCATHDCEVAYACCWLPLLLIAFGVSAAGVSAFFEAYRPWFLGATALLLAGGFYFVYFRKPACAPGDACAMPAPRAQRFNRIMLWMATALVLAFALFPNYAARLLGGSRDDDAVASGTTLDFNVSGMTCAACAAGLEKELAGAPGVVAARVDYMTNVRQ